MTLNSTTLRSNFIDFKSFLESNTHEILNPCNTNLDDSIGSLSMKGYLP